MIGNAQIVRHDSGAGSEQIWPVPPQMVDVTSPAAQSEAVGVFLNPASCDASHYLVANVRGDLHAQGSWLTLATLEWVDGVATVIIREPGKADIAIPRSDTAAASAAIAAQLASLLAGANNVQPTSAYRRGG